MKWHEAPIPCKFVTNVHDEALILLDISSDGGVLKFYCVDSTGINRSFEIMEEDWEDLGFEVVDSGIERPLKDVEKEEEVVSDDRRGDLLDKLKKIYGAVGNARKRGRPIKKVITELGLAEQGVLGDDIEKYLKSYGLRVDGGSVYLPEGIPDPVDFNWWADLVKNTAGTLEEAPSDTEEKNAVATAEGTDLDGYIEDEEDQSAEEEDEEGEVLTIEEQRRVNCLILDAYILCAKREARGLLDVVTLADVVEWVHNLQHKPSKVGKPPYADVAEIGVEMTPVDIHEFLVNYAGCFITDEEVVQPPDGFDLRTVTSGSWLAEIEASMEKGEDDYLDEEEPSESKEEVFEDEEEPSESKEEPSDEYPDADAIVEFLLSRFLTYNDMFELCRHIAGTLIEFADYCKAKAEEGGIPDSFDTDEEEE